MKVLLQEHAHVMHICEYPRPRIADTARIDALEVENDALETRNDALETRNDDLKQLIDSVDTSECVVLSKCLIEAETMQKTVNATPY